MPKRNRTPLTPDPGPVLVEQTFSGIPLLEPEDSELPTTTELAEALGLDEQHLREEVRDEERQRHPGANDDPEDAGDPDDLARVFRQRLNDG